MGAREDLQNLGIVNPYDAAKVALACDLPPVWIERENGNFRGWKVLHLLYKVDAGLDRIATDQQVHRFGDWQYHSPEHGLVAAQSFASRLAKDAAFVKITGLGPVLFAETLAALLKGKARDYRLRARDPVAKPHEFVRTDDVGRKEWTHVIDPCNCSLARIAKIHRGG